MKFNFTHINKCDVEIDFSVESSLKSFKEEVLDHFYNVCKKKDVMILFSGGNDSRFIARTLIELGIPFKTCTYSYKKDLSDYDATVSAKFARDWKLKNDLIYLNPRLFCEYVKEISKDPSYVYIIQNTYFMQYMMKVQQENGFDGIFLSAAGSEYKIINGKIPLPHNNQYILQNNIDKWFNFTTSRTLLSYVRNPIFLKEYKQTKEKGFDIRDKIYKDAYPDTEFIKKTRGEERHIEEWYWKNLPQISFHNPRRFITDVFEWDFEQYLKQKKLIK